MGCLALEGGWFPEKLRTMAWPDAMLLWDELEERPPLRMTFSAFVGYKSKKKHPPKPITNKELLTLQKMMGGVKSQAPPMVQDAIKWAEEMKAKHRIQ